MRVRFVGALGALIAVAMLTALGTMPAAAGGKGNGNKLSKHDRALLAEQRAEGESRTTLLVATNEGSAAAVAASLAALGGTIQYRDDLLGYIRVSLPLDKAEPRQGGRHHGRRRRRAPAAAGSAADRRGRRPGGRSARADDAGQNPYMPIARHRCSAVRRGATRRGTAAA